MVLRKLLSTMVSGVDAIIKQLNWAACGVLCLMALAVVDNVVGRFLFNRPLLGVVEIVEVMMVIIGFLFMPYTALKQEHVRIDLVVTRFSRRTQVIIGRIMFFLGAGTLAVVTYQAILFAISYAQDLSQATYVLSIPLAPFRAIMALGCLLLCLKLALSAFHPLPPEEGQKGDSSK